MGKTVASLATLLLLSALCAQETLKKPQQAEAAAPAIWEAAYLDNGRAGYFATSFLEVEADGVKIIRSRQSLHLTVKRFDEVSQLRMQTGTDETTEGKVVGVFMRMEQGDIPLILEGKVKDKVLSVEIKDRNFKREIPWNDKVIGLRGQELLFAQKKFKAGDKLDYQAYEPSLNTVVTVRAVVHDEEEVELADRQKKKLFRVVLTADKIDVPQGPVQLPAITVWMDKEGKIQRRQVEIPGLGKIQLVRTTREAALGPLKPATFVDVGLKHMIALDRRIRQPNETEKAVYRITIDDDKPETALAKDERQEVKGVKDKTIELHVRAIRTAPEDGKGEADKEFLEDCRFIDSGNAKVKALAKEAVGDETDAWFKARRIEGWVHRNLTTDAAVKFCPAGEVAEHKRGDCRQYALLTAAMCRAIGVPSRTAIGLIYAERRDGKAMFGFHMWTEVFVRGQWLGLDATLGEGSIGATHIKVTDHSWAAIESLTPLLPLQRVLGKMKVEVVQVDY